MKEKLFEKLKQAYSSLGLGDVILQAHAEALAATNLVTEENIDSVVLGQRPLLENLQKSNDKRVKDALDKAKADAEEKQRRAAEEAEAKRKEEAENAAKAAKEAQDKAIADALAKQIADIEAKRKAEEEAAAKKREEEELAKRMKDKEIPEWFKIQQEAQAKKEAELNAQIKALLDGAEAAKVKQAEEKDTLTKQIEALLATSKATNESLTAIKAENDALKAAKAKQMREDLISSIAKKLEIPQYRIDEGLPVFADDATEEDITSKLSVIANNIKVNQIPTSGGNSPIDLKGEVSKADADEIAKSLVL